MEDTGGSLSATTTIIILDVVLWIEVKRDPVAIEIAAAWDSQAEELERDAPGLLIHPQKFTVAVSPLRGHHVRGIPATPRGRTLGTSAGELDDDEPLPLQREVPDDSAELSWELGERVES
ncbi:hypothetical protein PG990_011077 [Apiospora arundinis]